MKLSRASISICVRELLVGLANSGAAAPAIRYFLFRELVSISSRALSDFWDDYAFEVEGEPVSVRQE